MCAVLGNRYINLPVNLWRRGLFDKFEIRIPRCTTVINKNQIRSFGDLSLLKRSADGNPDAMRVAVGITRVVVIAAEGVLRKTTTGKLKYRFG